MATRQLGTIKAMLETVVLTSTATEPTMATVRDRVTVLDTALTEMTERLTRAAERLERLDALAEKTERRLARGTMDGELQAGAPASHGSETTHTRAKRATVAPPPRAKRGTAGPALACWVGDEGSTPELNAAVERLIRERPLTRRQLVEMTGCTNVNRVAGAIVNLQRNGTPIVNLGTQRRGVWYIVPERLTR